MNDKEMILIQKKIKFFSESNIKIHIQTIKDRFYNGVVSEIKDDFIIFQDRMLGEMPIFYSEITKVERFKEERNERN